MSATTQINFTLSGDLMDLDKIRCILTRLEDTIIFSLIERAQFAYNPKIYQKGAFKELTDIGFEGSMLDWFLKETETFHAKARRFTSPDEYPFTPVSELPEPLLKPIPYPKLLHPNNVNVNPSILSFYTRSIVPRITGQATVALAYIKRANGIIGEAEFEDDGNYGSAGVIDMETLQAISKRVHYGKFVAEIKFLEHPEAFIPYIQNRNRKALENLITKPDVEARLLKRLRTKASVYAQDFGPDGTPRGGIGKIDVDGVVDLYKLYIIPLTKDVEVDYLLARLEGVTQKDIDSMMSGAGKIGV